MRFIVQPTEETRLTLVTESFTQKRTHTDGGGKITVTSTTIYVSHLWGDSVQSLSSWVELSLLGHVSMLWDGGKD